jgi:hypothetical protein
MKIPLWVENPSVQQELRQIFHLHMRYRNYELCAPYLQPNETPIKFFPSICTQETTRERLNLFSWNLVLEILYKIYRYILHVQLIFSVNLTVPGVRKQRLPFGRFICPNCYIQQPTVVFGNILKDCRSFLFWITIKIPPTRIYRFTCM